MVVILSAINKEMFPIEIYMKISSKMNTKEFYDGMSALFALQKIEIIKDGRIKNVKRNQM